MNYLKNNNHLFFPTTGSGHYLLIAMVLPSCAKDSDIFKLKFMRYEQFWVHSDRKFQIFSQLANYLYCLQSTSSPKSLCDLWNLPFMWSENSLNFFYDQLWQSINPTNQVNLQSRILANLEFGFFQSSFSKKFDFGTKKSISRKSQKGTKIICLRPFSTTLPSAQLSRRYQLTNQTQKTSSLKNVSGAPGEINHPCPTFQLPSRTPPKTAPYRSRSLRRWCCPSLFSVRNP